MPNQRHVEKTVFVFACLFVVLLSLAVNSCVPFLTLPTLGQAVLTIGYAQSYINHGLFTIFSHNFGYPYPASIAFGLSGSLLTSFFMRFGISGNHAYTLMQASYLLLALYGAVKLFACCNSNKYMNILFALLWMCFPVIRMHMGYGMLATGFALLPFYFYAFYNFSSRLDTAFLYKSRQLFLFVFATILAVFMDGYTYVMFAVTVGIGMLGLLVAHRNDIKRFLLHIVLPSVLAFGFSSLLYLSFIKFQSFPKSPITFFTSWGADLVMFLVPTKGIFYLFDVLHLSVFRDGKLYFGDSSVWKNTFLFPIFLLSIIAFALAMKSKTKKTFIFVALAIAFIGVYMSLGPYLKVNFIKRDLPLEATRTSSLLMSETQRLLMPTGSSFLSKNLPGFNRMRASYRWIGLGFLGCWLLMIQSSQDGTKNTLFFLFVVLLILAYFPNLKKQIIHGSRKIQEYKLMERQYVQPLSKLLMTGEVVAFVPWGNDFLVNHVAASLDIKAYNIGGDKNLFIARQRWPKTLIKMGKNRDSKEYIKNIYHMFAYGECDKVVLSKIDLLRSALQWPPAKHKNIKTIRDVLETIRQDNILSVSENDHYALLSLDSTVQNVQNIEELLVKRNFFSNDYQSKESILADNYTQVGLVKNKTLVTTGIKGFLLYGPYIELVKGNYKMLINGELQSGSLTVDIVSDKGKTVHFKKSVTAPLSEILLEDLFYLPETVKDLEVRIFVEEDTNASIKSYRLNQ